MIKFCIIGAGSAEFTRRIVGDLLREKAFANMHLALTDIDGERLQTATRIVAAVARQLGATPTVTATTDRKAALTDADFVQTTIQVGGYRPATVVDFEIPKKYGVRQTIGDTLGIGGIMRGLRTVPVLTAIAADIAALCPNALWLQYVNPMAINMLGIAAAFPQIRSIGLCHSVTGTAAMLARDLGEPLEDIDYDCAGVNHMAFYTRFVKRNGNGGEDLYPRLREHARRVLAGEAESTREPEVHGGVLAEKVRYEVLLRFGYFVTESSEHFAEYVPWFVKPARADLVERYDIPLDEYLLRCESSSRRWGELERTIGEESEAPPLSREYALPLVGAVALGGEAVVHANVINRGDDGACLIPNLPAAACVEVPCVVNGDGVTPQTVDALPPQLAALMQTNINVQLLTAEALASGKREHVYHAAMLDPLTAATLSLDKICAMVDELLAAHGSYIPPLR